MQHENQRNFSKGFRQRLKEQQMCVCSRCNQSFTPKRLEIHHNHVWKGEAKRFAIPGDYVASPPNALVLCENCHDQLHKEIPYRLTHHITAGLLAIGEMTEDQSRARKLARQVEAMARDEFFSKTAPIRRS
jgi:hypothetical protein